MKMIKTVFSLTLVLILSLLCMTSCAAERKIITADAESNFYSQAPGSYDDYLVSEKLPIADEVKTEQKLVRSAYLVLETKTFDDDTKAMEDAVKKYGGYVETSEESGRSEKNTASNRYATYTVRIPAESLDAYVADMEAICNVTRKSITQNDVTEGYYDTQARLNSLKTEEERLLVMLEQAEDLSYLLELNKALADVRYQIESYTSQMNRYDNKISYATVNLSVQEVAVYTPAVEQTFGERLLDAIGESWDNFTDGVEDFVIGFVYVLPGLLIFAVFVVVIVLIIVRASKKSRVRREKELEAYRQAQMNQNQNIKKDTDA